MYPTKVFARCRRFLDESHFLRRYNKEYAKKVNSHKGDFKVTDWEPKSRHRTEQIGLRGVFLLDRIIQQKAL